jgi:uncharacterized membrane protein YkgB
LANKTSSVFCCANGFKHFLVMPVLPLNKKMNLPSKRFNKIDKKIALWMAKNGVKCLRASIGIIFLWFGGLKFFDGLSPAQNLAIDTIQHLTLAFFSSTTIIYGLAIWEILIGLGLLFNLMLRETLLLLYLQMLGTFTPIFIFPDKVFTEFPYALTLEGQYIIKNLVIVGAGIVIGATVRGGRIITQDE